MAEIINGMELDTPFGQYQYVGEYLVRRGASSMVLGCLRKLYMAVKEEEPAAVLRDLKEKIDAASRESMKTIEELRKAREIDRKMLHEPFTI